MTMLNKLQRKLDRLNEMKVRLKTRYEGNELNYTYHAGYDLGYIEGQIRELENFIDLS